MKIFLVGLSGVGKSTFGKKLSRKMGYSFVDLDMLIEENSESSIEEIFENYGESHFRELEAKALRSIIDSDVVISCGGGTPCFKDNLSYMKEQGLMVYLELALGAIVQRLKNSHNRPLIGLVSEEEIRQKLSIQLQERQPYYEQADLSVDMLSITAAKMNELALALLSH